MTVDSTPHEVRESDQKGNSDDGGKTHDFRFGSALLSCSLTTQPRGGNS